EGQHRGALGGAGHAVRLRRGPAQGTTTRVVPVHLAQIPRQARADLFDDLEGSLAYPTCPLRPSRTLQHLRVELEGPPRPVPLPRRLRDLHGELTARLGLRFVSAREVKTCLGDAQQRLVRPLLSDQAPRRLQPLLDLPELEGRRTQSQQHPLQRRLRGVALAPEGRPRGLTLT